ncbi:hypothetical protein D9M69_442310 [compost metagenome]
MSIWKISAILFSGIELVSNLALFSESTEVPWANSFSSCRSCWTCLESASGLIPY